jgi:hypothetical protein
MAWLIFTQRVSALATTTGIRACRSKFHSFSIICSRRNIRRVIDRQTVLENRFGGEGRSMIRSGSCGSTLLMEALSVSAPYKAKLGADILNGSISEIFTASMPLICGIKRCSFSSESLTSIRELPLRIDDASCSTDIGKIVP